MERLLFMDDTFEECAVIGRHQMRKVELLENGNPEKGVSLTYAGGKMCSSYQDDYIPDRKTITMRLICSPSQDDSFHLLDDLNEYDILACHVYMAIHTPAGCPTGYVTRYSSTEVTVFM